MFKKRNIFIGIVIAAAVGVFFYMRSSGDEEERVTESVRRGTVTEIVSVTGKLVPVEYADLSFSSVGRIEEVLAEEGAAVQKGEVLAMLDASVLEAQLQEARTALARAEANERLARRNWDSLKPEARQAEKLTTEQARDDVRVVLAQIANSRLTAPIAGLLTQFDLRVGEVATAGEVLARITRDATLIMEARVPESDIAKVAVGMPAQIGFDALRSDEILSARVVDIEPAATVLQDVVSYVVTLRLDTPDPRLKDGMTADVDIETAKSEHVLLVPFRVLTTKDSRTYAEVMGADGSLERREVVTGVEGDDGTIEVRSGLKEGEQVTLGTRQTN